MNASFISIKDESSVERDSPNKKSSYNNELPRLENLKTCKRVAQKLSRNFDYESIKKKNYTYQN